MILLLRHKEAVPRTSKKWREQFNAMIIQPKTNVSRRHRPICFFEKRYVRTHALETCTRLDTWAHPYNYCRWLLLLEVVTP
jgi:hypothetical protein